MGSASVLASVLVSVLGLGRCWGRSRSWRRCWGRCRCLGGSRRRGWGRCRRRGGCRSWGLSRSRRSNWGIHVGLNLRLAQRPVVDAHLVNCSAKVFSKDRVAPHPDSSNGRNHVAGSGCMGHLTAIQIQRLTGRRVVGGSQIGPSIERNWRGSIQFMERSCDDIDKRPVRGRIGKQPPNQITDFWSLLN